MVLLPTENQCVERVKELVLERGLKCECMSSLGFYWKQNRVCFECKSKTCKSAISLKSLTKIKRSKLPFKIWLGGVFLYAVDSNITPRKMCEELNHNTYSTIWKMFQKIEMYDKKTLDAQANYLQENDTNIPSLEFIDLRWMALNGLCFENSPIEYQDHIWNWLIEI